jgi:hypothetical protein
LRGNKNSTRPRTRYPFYGNLTDDDRELVKWNAASGDDAKHEYAQHVRELVGRGDSREARLVAGTASSNDDGSYRRHFCGGGTYARSIAVVLYTHPDRDNFDFRYTCPLVEFYNGDDDEYGKENVADGKSELTRRHIAAYTGAQMVNLAAISTNPCTLWPTVACTPA